MKDAIEVLPESMKPRLFAVADALGMDLKYNREHSEIHGTTKRKVELFEGYSPTICPTIESSIVCSSAKVVAAQGQIFGNLGFVITCEAYGDLVSLFLYDRSKTPENVDCTPFQQWGWSRKRLYFWLEKSVKAVYFRSMFDDEWKRHPCGPKQIAEYNRARDNGAKAKDAYELVWGGVYE